jgi:hypothetical protein
MAKYINDKGDTIETASHVYRIFDANGILVRSADVSKWGYQAEKWIDNDILSGYYKGFKKVEE